MYVPGKSSSLSIRRINYQRYQFWIFVDQSESTFKQKKNKKKKNQVESYNHGLNPYVY